MAYEVEWASEALDDLRKLDKEIRNRIIEKVEQAREMPDHYIRELAGTKMRKLRVGDYRVFIDVFDEHKLLQILRIKKRDDAYKRQ